MSYKFPSIKMRELSKMARYNQFADIVAQVRPKTIVEIGTHVGKRAVLLSGLALRYSEKVSYLGFDIFEDGDQTFNDAALNEKGLPSMHAARHALGNIERQMDGRFSWELVKGDTRLTLAGRSIKADLVFIDGDHRLETIRTDYAAVRDSKCVIFDDYLLRGEDGALPDLNHYGANGVVNELPKARILPAVDRAKSGWRTAFAMVLKP